MHVYFINNVRYLFLETFVNFAFKNYVLSKSQITIFENKPKHAHTLFFIFIVYDIDTYVQIWKKKKKPSKIILKKF